MTQQTIDARVRAIDSLRFQPVGLQFAWGAGALNFATVGNKEIMRSCRLGLSDNSIPIALRPDSGDSFVWVLVSCYLFNNLDCSVYIYSFSKQHLSPARCIFRHLRPMILVTRTLGSLGRQPDDIGRADCDIRLSAKCYS